MLVKTRVVEIGGKTFHVKAMDCDVQRLPEGWPDCWMSPLQATRRWSTTFNGWFTAGRRLTPIRALGAEATFWMMELGGVHVAIHSAERDDEGRWRYYFSGEKWEDVDASPNASS